MMRKGDTGETAHLIHVAPAAAPLIAARVLLLLLLLLLRQAVPARPAAHAAWVIPPHAAAAAAQTAAERARAVLSLPAVLPAPVLTAGETAVVRTARGPPAGCVRGCAACGGQSSNTCMKSCAPGARACAGRLSSRNFTPGFDPAIAAVHAPRCEPTA